LPLNSALGTLRLRNYLLITLCNRFRQLVLHFQVLHFQSTPVRDRQIDPALIYESRDSANKKRLRRWHFDQTRSAAQIAATTYDPQPDKLRKPSLLGRV